MNSIVISFFFIVAGLEINHREDENISHIVKKFIKMTKVGRDVISD